MCRRRTLRPLPAASQPRWCGASPCLGLAGELRSQSHRVPYGTRELGSVGNSPPTFGTRSKEQESHFSAPHSQGLKGKRGRQQSWGSSYTVTPDTGHQVELWDVPLPRDLHVVGVLCCLQVYRGCTALGAPVMEAWPGHGNWLLGGRYEARRRLLSLRGWGQPGSGRFAPRHSQAGTGRCQPGHRGSLLGGGVRAAAAAQNQDRVIPPRPSEWTGVWTRAV